MANEICQLTTLVFMRKKRQAPRHQRAIAVTVNPQQ